MKKNVPALIVMMFFFLTARGYAADWKSLADDAIGLSPAAVNLLEGKKDKTEPDVYQLTLIFYRQYDHARLKKLWAESEKKIPESPALKLLQGIILMREHRGGESRAVLNGLLKAHPDFYPVLIVLSHLNYLQKDFDRSYQLARQLLAKKKELSRYHRVVALLLAAASKGTMTKKNLARAIPAYFEVNGYFKEARKLMPDAAEVLYGLGSYHLLTPPVAGGDIDLAIGMLEKSKQLTPLNANVYLRLAQAYRAKKNEAAYAKNIQRAMELDLHDELLQDYLSGEKAFLDVP